MQLEFPFPRVAPQCRTCGAYWQIEANCGECLVHVGPTITRWVIVNATDTYNCHSSLRNNEDR